MATHFETTPNEVIVSGAESATFAAQRLVVADDGVRVVARGGLLSGSREIDLPFADVVDVRYEEAITYELVLETDDTTYTITNVTGDEAEAERISAFVADRAGLYRSSSPADATEPTAVSDGGDTEPGAGSNTADATDASDVGTADETAVAQQLREFARLRDDGIITDDEFRRKKRDLLEDN